MPHARRDGWRVHYHVEGSGPPLLLHVGFTGAMHVWYEEGWVAALRDRYTVILLDPLGHGESDKPHDPAAYAAAGRVADVLAVLDDAGVERTHFHGYSMGARAGFDLAVQAPQRLLTLVLGGMHPFARDPQEARQRAELFAHGIEAAIAAVERQSGPLPAERRARALRQDAAALVATSIAMGDVPDLEAALPGITIPTLIFCGDQDLLFAGAQRAATLIPSATFVPLPGLGHVPAAGFDAAFPLVSEFLQQHAHARP